MSIYIQEQVTKIDNLLTEFRTSPELYDEEEFNSCAREMRLNPHDFLEQIERFIFYDEPMKFWLAENIGADMADLSEEVLSVFVRTQYPSLTFDALEGLKISLGKKYMFIFEQIKDLIKES